VDDARQLLSHIDSNLGKPLPEKDYGGNCLIYDSSNPEDPFHNFWVIKYFLVLVLWFFRYSDKINTIAAKYDKIIRDYFY